MVKFQRKEFIAMWVLIAVSFYGGSWLNQYIGIQSNAILGFVVFTGIVALIFYYTWKRYGQRIEAAAP